MKNPTNPYKSPQFVSVEAGIQVKKVKKNQRKTHHIYIIFTYTFTIKIKEHVNKYKVYGIQWDTSSKKKHMSHEEKPLTVQKQSWLFTRYPYNL